MATKRPMTGGPRRRRWLLGAALLGAAALLAACEPAPPPGTSSSPSGHVDVIEGGPGGVRVAGWASDWDTLAPIKVVIYLNGQAARAVVADRDRPDVAAAFGRGPNFGFDEQIPAPVGRASVCVSAVNVGPGDHTLLGCGSTEVVPLPAGTSGVPTPTAPPSTVPPEPAWRSVANNGDLVPGTSQAFNSYNQPSVNENGLVTFRARAKGEGGRGVYIREATVAGSPLRTVAAVGGVVPQPNNLDSTFLEFPSIPRIDDDGSMVATRGQSQPVWTYTPDGGVETRIGTSGIYSNVGGELVTSASLLGLVPGFEKFGVPGAEPPARFDQFPGAPTVDGTTIVFKGNYTLGDRSGTGIFYRDAAVPAAGTHVIADVTTVIPGQTTLTFGSTAPPTATDGLVVFTGLDNEEAPTSGGVYLAPVRPRPPLEPLVSIGEQVPGQGPDDRFSLIGEGLSFDGRYVTFWGAWGETTPITLQCPQDGNKDLIAYCAATYPDGFTTDVPVHQGIFVHDTQTGVTRAVAVADSADPGAEFSTVQYWTFSGKPPSDTGGDGSQELPRWRSSAFAAVSGGPAGYKVALKGTEPSGTVGIHLASGPDAPSTRPVVVTGNPGPDVDPEAPADTAVTSVGLERDGFRGRYLALSVGMANADASATWGGIYLVTVDRLGPPPPVEVPPAIAEPHVQQADPS